MISNSNLVTQEKVLWLNEITVDDPVIDDSQVDDGSVTPNEDQPFLKINDRTVYKTADDAVKGFNEAQQTITSLSEFKKVLKELGAPENADAQYLKGVLTEYIKLASERASAGAASKTKVTPSEEDKEFEGVDPQVVAQTKRGRQWLKENASKVGLISKDDYDKLKQEFDEFRGSFSQKEEQEREAAIEEGQQNVTKWLGEAKVDLDQQERLKLENLIAAYVNSDPGLTQKWLRGDRAAKMELIKEGYSMFLPVVKPGASPFAKAASAAAAGKTKIGLVSKTRNLPQNDGTSSEVKGGKKVPLRVGDTALRNRAYDLMKKFEAEQNGE